MSVQESVLLCGVRFKIDYPADFDEKGEWRALRSGTGSTVVVEAEPVSGPIHRHYDRRGYFARCRCGERSKHYQKRHAPQILAWAHAHRCIVIWARHDA